MAARALFAAPGAPGISRLSEKDLVDLVPIYASVFRPRDQSGPAALAGYTSYLRRVFLENPWRDSAAGALVHRESDGRITGFLGVMPRRYVYRDEEITAAVSSHFMVDPAARATMAGVKLLSALFSGPQDLSLTDESNDSSRLIWERLGGQTVFAQSIRWTWPVRPFEFATELSSRLWMGKLLHRAALPGARALDAAAVRFKRGPFVRTAPVLHSVELSPAELASRVAASGRSVRPLYDSETLKWLLGRAENMPDHGALQKVLVTTPGGDPVGWYLYYLKPGGKCEVLQFYAVPRFLTEVLGHMLYHAWERGGVVLAGSAHPAMWPAFRDHSGFLWRRGQWALAHSRRPELVDAFHRGDAFFTRLDGEWCQTHAAAGDLAPGKTTR